MPRKAPQPRRKRPRRPWWRRPIAATAAQTGVIVIGVGIFLRLTVSSFDSDEIKELGAVAAAAATVIRLWQSKT